MDHPYTQEKLQALFDEKLAALKRYLAITDEMETEITNSDLRQLKSLIFNRQKYMRKIQQIDKKINSIKQLDLKKSTNTLYNNLAEIYDRYRQDYLCILKAVSPMDENVFFMLERQSEKIKTELLTIKKNKNAASSYGSNKINISKYLDTRR